MATLAFAVAATIRIKLDALVLPSVSYTRRLTY